jgi:hypothetical protein
MQPPLRPVRYSIWLMLAGTVLWGAGSADGQAVSQNGSNSGSASHHRHSLSARRSWHSGPASTPPQTEVIPSPPPNVAPATSPLLGWQREEENRANGRTNSLDEPTVTTSETYSAVRERSPGLKISEHVYSKRSDPESLIRDELRRVRQDTEARRAFYDDLLGTVHSVRASTRRVSLGDDDSSADSGAPPARPSASHDAVSVPSSPPGINDRGDSRPQDARERQSAVAQSP